MLRQRQLLKQVSSIHMSRIGFQMITWEQNSQIEARCCTCMLIVHDVCFRVLFSFFQMLWTGISWQRNWKILLLLKTSWRQRKGREHHMKGRRRYVKEVNDIYIVPLLPYCSKCTTIFLGLSEFFISIKGDNHILYFVDCDEILLSPFNLDYKTYM